jgi:hypothetical protein
MTGYWSVFKLTTAILIGVFYSVVPLALTLSFRRKFSQFRSKKFLDKFGDAIENLNFRNPNSTNIFSIFCYRRLV